MKKTLAIIITVLLAVTAFTVIAFGTSKNIKPETQATEKSTKATVSEVLTAQEAKTTLREKADSQQNKPEAAPHTDLTTVKATEAQQAAKAGFSKDEAKAVALAHAGVKEADIRNYKIETDRERNVTAYEIEFDAGNYEYDYIINAESGKILHSEVEKDRKAAQVTNKQNNTADQNSTVDKAPEKTPAEAKITKEEAKAAALAHAGLAEKEISRFKAELDKERNVLVYEIEFEAGKYEYEYEVNAENGKVIKNEKEYRD